MRVWWVVLLLPGANALVLEDPTGDVEQAWVGAPAQLVSHDALDLVRFELVEEPERFTFHVDVLEPTQTLGPPTGWRTIVAMQHGEQRYEHRISYFYALGAVEPQPFPWVEVYAQSDEQWVLTAAVDLHGSEGRHTWSLPRTVLADERGAPPEIGGSFDAIQVRSEVDAQMDGGLPSLWRFADALPDDGTARHPIELGLPQQGARLTSFEPYRASNGEAGRFMFRAALEAEEAGRFELSLEDIPRGWSMRINQTTLNLEANETGHLLIEATVPFAHQHGSRETFRLVARSEDALAQIAMGIHYVDIPQPSGHHPRVWVHSDDDAIASMLPVTRSGTRASAYINAVEDDLGDSGAPVQPSRSGLLNIGEGGSRMVLHYELDLRPQLRLGLNVTDAVTDFEVAFDLATPLPAATLRGALQSWRPDTWTDLATIDAPTADLAPGVHTITGTLTGSPRIVAYEQPLRMRVLLELHADAPDVHLSQVTPYLLPVGWFDLPLAEYEDSIADASGFVQASKVEAVDVPAEPAPEKESPLPVGLALVALALAWRLRQ